jgi:YVTN family beta-propeller protein
MTNHIGRPIIRRGLASASFLTAILISVGTGTTRAQALNHAYVANTSLNAVSVIDTTSNTVDGGPITVGLNPTQVAISPDGSTVFVGNTVSKTVSIIDTLTNTSNPSDAIALADEPSSLAVSPDGTKLYVLGSTGTLTVFSTTTKDVLGTSTVGTGGGKIAVATTPAGVRVLVAAGTVTILDGDGRPVTSSFAPEMISDPNIYNFAVSVAISPDGNSALVPFGTYNYNGPFGFSASGGVAVINLDPSKDNFQKVTAQIPLFSLPNSIAITHDGLRAYVGIQAYWANSIYVAGWLPGHWVTSIDTAMQTTISWIDLGAGTADFSYNTPAALDVTPDRSGVFVSVPIINSVMKIDTATDTLFGNPTDVGGKPLGVAIVPDAAAKPAAFVIDAVDDNDPTPLAALAGGLAVQSVLGNDTLGSGPAAVGNVNLTLVSSDNPGVTLNVTDGSVWVSADTSPGPHSLTYQICEKVNPGNCDQAAVTLSVRPPFAIHAADDSATSFAGVKAIPSVLGNDTLEGGAASGSVSLSVLSASAGLSLDPSDGSVSVAAGTPAGDRSLAYRICEIASPANCSQATAYVTVVARAIHAGDDSASTPRTGGLAIANVLANDTLDGGAATLGTVTLTQTSSSPGLVFNTATGSVSVMPNGAPGTLSLTYRICEIAGANNCSDGTVTVTVAQSLIIANPDSGKGSSKAAGPVVANVLANDSVNGQRATTANVNLSLVSIVPANNMLRLNADGSVTTLGKTTSSASSFTLVYQICEAASPSNCANGTVSVSLSGGGGGGGGGK